MSDLGQEIPWDGSIQNDGEDFTPLPEGEYKFTVAYIEKLRFDGSAKMGACNIAKVCLKIHPSNRQVFHRLFMNTKSEWALCQFFKSIGMRKTGERMHFDWSKVPGKSGYCRLVINGDYNNVDRFLDAPPEFESPNKVSVPEPNQAAFIPGEF